MIPIKFKRRNKVAVVTGATGQDGSYLCEYLLNKGYFVVGVCRRSSVDNTERIKHLKDESYFRIVEGDITDPSSVNSLITEFRPEEFYNLAAQSHVGTSFSQPCATFDIDAIGVINILEAIRNINPSTKFYQASTSEMFGRNYSGSGEGNNKFQNEETPFSPQSPYAVAKIAAHESVGLYRRAYDLHASCGILFNHESERRGENFVTRKITKWIGRYIAWLNQDILSTTDCNNSCSKDYNNFLYKSDCIEAFPKLRLGNFDSFRDWGHAEDYVKAMYLMLQQESPDDYVIATGKTYSVKEFLDIAFSSAGIHDWSNLVVQDPEFMRPAEVDYLCGCPKKAKEKLGWEPEVSFEQLVSRMVNYDISSEKTTNKAFQY